MSTKKEKAVERIRLLYKRIHVCKENKKNVNIKASQILFYDRLIQSCKREIHKLRARHNLYISNSQGF